MVPARPLAEQQPGQHGGEHRRQVAEEDRQGRTGPRHAAIPQQVADDRREHRDVGEHGPAPRRVELRADVEHQPFDERAGEREQRAEHDLREQQDGGGQRGTAHPQQPRVEAPQRRREQHEEIARQEGQRDEPRRVAVQQHHQHADDRHRGADQAPSVERFAEARDAEDQREHRRRRRDQRHVGGRRRRQREVLQRVVGAHAEHAEHRDRQPLAAQLRGVDRQGLPHERQDQQAREEPAQRVERHRRDQSGGEPADDRVAGPAQRRHDQQDQRDRIGTSGALHGDDGVGGAPIYQPVAAVTRDGHRPHRSGRRFSAVARADRRRRTP